MKLGLLLTPGDSLKKQYQSGQLDRLVSYYLKPYAKDFDRVYLFSYADASFRSKLPPKVVLVPKPKLIPYRAYQLLLPFFYPRLISGISVFRVFQATGGLPAALMRLIYRKPYVVTYGYDYAQFAHIDQRPGLAKLLNWATLPSLKLASKIIVTSPEVERDLKRRGYAEKVVFLPNGVDPRVFKPAPRSKKPYQVLTVGRLTHQKNHQLMLKIVSLSRHRSKIDLVIVGRGPLKKSLIKTAKKLKLKLTFLPPMFHQKLLSYYQQAGVFALTSKIEGQPKVLLEALSCACATLTTPFAGNLVKDNHTGLVAATAPGLARKLDRLLVSPKLAFRLGRAGRRFVKENFDIKKLIYQEIELLKSCPK
ncbi:MAG: Glycosyl transferase, group 1 [Candidatus Beckwithbacteria bacterium GW2011_GWB1_47_15]|uniref:Glycosyl transferase, group 1 n=1 Tax=Candidatus Beckwithbacteria bacterium GW2011_GWB1_47_15 TaxID=1618371 RepID=A0A0G1RUT0_9BACT|nr:MAG: glycosyl transferase, group 1 [Candidatus Beckwithbacteria bacterium GW2011_GWC1_49_16]KKU35708.1 MAG: Glycosyl transferase, group 1 [Candidatus Beckwithbacteria bacterium GW2011_GWA1_46_30]KKU60907.1 MAG: Glycosyl transferase, group 1 [Candidatus Beckwithbacteria bacterium GW2011_GWB1_47_15]KKU72267.1 MAG: Glycosyl transferase, group 1 [Candidatus Beckwithbacteria bacterium GW2011_GWA2_47_25]KKW04973.1 MAG: Glycosyl transferase, group 1 [Candidatus Beckwithbacteria bacterium GW2011_GWC